MTQASSTWIGDLAAAALRHRAVNHPYLRALERGESSDPAGAVADFARVYPVYSRHFPRYLRTVMRRLDDVRHQDLLLENLLEEKGHLAHEELQAIEEAGIDPRLVQNVPHPVLFHRFQHALGVTTADDGEEIARAAVIWRDTLVDLLENGSPAHAVGALGVGTECIVRHIYPYFLRAIQRWSSVDRPSLVFFELHCLVDDKHNAALASIAEDLSADLHGRKAVREGMLAALEARARFWDAMLQRLAVQQKTSAA